MGLQRKHFASSQAFAAWITHEHDAYKSDPSSFTRRQQAGSGAGSRGRYRTYNRDIYFNSVHQVDQGIDHIREGNETHVQDAKDLLNEFQENIEVPAFQWETHMVGAFPNVPAFLAGAPETMWHRQEIQSDRSPLRVFVGLTSSAGVPEEALVKRGCVLSAFAMAIAPKRPVLITPYVNLGDGYANGSILGWDVSTSPMVLSEIMACLADPMITRHAGIAANYLHEPQCTGSWHPHYSDAAKMREHLGAKPADLYLPSIHLSDPMLRDPLKWLKDNIERYTEEESDNYGD